MFLMHATQLAESVRPPSNDERRAEWAAKYFGAGYHNRPNKPRVRAEAPLPAMEPADAGKDSSK
jgi:hypothetical protein